MSQKNYELLLEWYEADPGESFVGEEQIDLTEEELAEILGLNSAIYPFAGGLHPLETKKEIRIIQELVNHFIDLNKYDYFITARAI